MMNRPEKIYDLRTFLTLFVSGEGHFCPFPGIWPQILCVWKIPEIAETLRQISADMRFVQNFTTPDVQAKNITPSISPNFNSFNDKNTKNE